MRVRLARVVVAPRRRKKNKELVNCAGAAALSLVFLFCGLQLASHVHLRRDSRRLLLRRPAVAPPREPVAAPPLKVAPPRAPGAQPAAAAPLKVALVMASTAPEAAWPGGDVERAIKDWRTLERVLDDHVSHAGFGGPLPRVVNGSFGWKGDGPAEPCAPGWAGREAIRGVRYKAGGASDHPRVEPECILGVDTAWRAATAALVEAYAATHGYDFYFADIHDCPRGPTWCQKLSVRALMAERRYDWYVALDEDVFIAELATPVDAFLARLAAPKLNRDDQPLDKAVATKRARTSSNALGRDASKVKAVVSKEVNGVLGINCGAMFFRHDAGDLLEAWWRVPDEDPSQRKFIKGFPREQGVFNTHVATDARWRDAVHVAPTEELYAYFDRPGRPLRDAGFAFHNTKGAGRCGRGRNAPGLVGQDPNAQSHLRVDCLMELLSPGALAAVFRAADRTAVREVPLHVDLKDVLGASAGDSSFTRRPAQRPRRASRGWHDDP